MSEVVGARVDDDVGKAIAYVAKEEGTDKSKVVRELLTTAVKEKLLDLALEKYAKRSVSMGRAAKLAGIPYADFMGACARRNVTMNYDLEDLKHDLRTLERRK